MKQSLHRTWLALGIAALAVLVVAIFAARDFSRELYADCPGGLAQIHVDRELAQASYDDLIKKGYEPVDTTKGKARIRWDAKSYKYGPEIYFDNVRIVRIDLDAHGHECECASQIVPWGRENAGDTPADIKVLRSPTGNLVVHAHQLTVQYAPTTVHARVHQPQSVWTMRNLPCVVVLVALLALVVALFRSRRAISYAMRLHAWTEATLTPAGRIEDENGAILANADSTLTSTQRRWPIPTGPVLIDPKGLEAGSLYREMPIVTRSKIVEGSHARWVSSTMVSLRDARTLAVLSTLCAALAYGARLVG